MPRFHVNRAPEPRAPSPEPPGRTIEGNWPMVLDDGHRAYGRQKSPRRLRLEPGDNRPVSVAAPCWPMLGPRATGSDSPTFGQTGTKAPAIAQTSLR